MRNIVLALSVAVIVPVVLAGCATTYKTCSTAGADVRSLYQEKAHAEKQREMGVSMIMPASAVVGVDKGAEGRDTE